MTAVQKHTFIFLFLFVQYSCSSKVLAHPAQVIFSATLILYYKNIIGYSGFLKAYETPETSINWFIS